MKNLPIFWKIFTIVIILVVLTLGLGAYFVMSTRNSTIDSNLNTLQLQAEDNADSFSNFMQGYIYLADFLSNDANVIGVYTDANDESTWLLKLFESITKSYKDVLSVYVGLKDKRMYLKPDQELPSDYDPTSRSWYKDAIANVGNVIITEPYTDVGTGKIVITVAKAVRSEEGITGVVGIDFDISSLSDNLLSAAKTFDYQIAVTNDSGTIILHSDASLVGKNIKDTEFFQRWVSGPESGSFSYTYNNEQWITGYKRAANGWIFATLVPQQDLMNTVNRQVVFMVIIISIIVIVGILISTVISRVYIVKPIVEIQTLSEKVATGDLTIQFKSESKDEIGRLSNALNAMVESLKGITLQIHDEAGTLKEEAAQIAAVSEETSATIEELTAQVDNVNANVNNASAAIEEMTSGIEEVAASAQNVANASQKLSEEARNVNDLANDGRNVIANVGEIINQTKIKANTTFETVEKLSSSAKNIGEIVDTINSIAEQTNLLALNAAIEAARAGEAGRGFAVVADEIRKLAEESKQATQNIANILRGILDESVKASEETRETVEIVNQATEQSSLVSSKFEQIVQSIMKVSQMVENLAASAQEQSAAAEEMSGAMDSASRSMVSVVEQMNEVTAATRQQADTIATIAKTAEELDSLAERLVSAVNKLKIS
ncbi:MAG TPA: methyl-accepting chemotaxis protein [Fervidobacterium sp.]|nr:methyl-accepting chemotaxis protein [Fervidobacterium sp.]